MSSACYFFRLPSELKFEVIDYLDDKRDLYNVSRSCQWLEDVVLKRLYNTVDIGIPRQHDPAWSTGRYLTLRPVVARAVQNIIFRDQGCEDARDSPPMQKTSGVICPESYSADLLSHTSANQLRSFSFMHRCPVSTDILQLLAGMHNLSLRHFSCYELDSSDRIPSMFPSNLLSIECRTLGDGDTLNRLVRANKSTLKTLQLGQERVLVQQYVTEKHGFQLPDPRSLVAFKSCVELSDIQNLQNLCLVGLDLAPLVPLDIEGALFLTNIQEFTIESCAGTSALLSAMASIFTFAQSEVAPEPRSKLSLEKFSLRQEVSTSGLKDALTHFLNSLSGLRTLSLLLENSSINMKPVDLITTHGSTLETLVIESRVQPRQSLRHDTSRAFGYGGYSSHNWEVSTNDVCRLCPNIVELGIGFPWNEEAIRIQQCRIPELASLKTMHIRNFPESSQLSQMGDYTIKEYATKFIEWTFKDIRGSKPQLEILSIGPSVYESRFKGSNPGRPHTPEFLRTHHFALDWAQTRFGCWSAMITSVSEKYMEETRCEKPLGGVFEPVWLK